MILAYYIFLLLIIFLLMLLIQKNLMLSPKKIRIYMTIVSSLLICRYIALFFICVIRNPNLAYFLKTILFLNHLAIPLMVLALSYVYLRWDTLSFSIDYIVAIILSLVYLAAMNIIKGKVILNPDFGYVVSLENEVLMYLISLIILGVLLLFCVYFFGKPNSNKIGMVYLIVGLSIVIVENIIYVGGIRVFPYPLIGDAIFIIIINLAINTFKKVK